MAADPVSELLPRPRLLFTAPWEPILVRRGDALGLGALADRLGDAVAPDFSNRITDGRWLTILAWCLCRSHAVFHKTGRRNVRNRLLARERYTWLRPLELMWVARTILLLEVEASGRPLAGQRRVRRWIGGAQVPAGTGTNYPDHVPNPCHAAFAVLAALRHRRRTGEGQYIDMAQTEPTIALLGPAVLDFTVNGRVGQPRGNEHPGAAPHGVYRCKGDERWIAICVMTNEHWHALRQVLRDPEWMREAGYDRVPGRLSRRAAIDGELNAETRAWTTEDLMLALQARGVPAGVVETAADVTRDPQLEHRGHWVKLDHPEMGESLYNAPPFRCSRTPVALSRPAPLLGQHTEEICRELLGLTDAEFKQLRDEGALT